MSSREMTSEKRDVKNFDQVYLKVRHEAELTITQDKQESLTIIAPKDILERIESTVKDGILMISSRGKWFEKVGDAVRTSVTRNVIKYNLLVKNLKYLEIAGLVRTTATGIKSDSLWLQLSGAGNVNITDLETKNLEVTLPGAGRITLMGKTLEQKITVKGAGEYYAPKLESKKTTLTVQGVGSTTVWVTEEFDVTVQGLGNVSYYGEPKVTSNMPNIGKLNSLGMPDW
ncbi:MAG: head GIN domain-containing protein [Promethearchaeota archaeon]|jgi:hypothetical protein